MATTPTKPTASTRTIKTQPKNAGKFGKEKPTNLLTSCPPHSRLPRRLGAGSVARRRLATRVAHVPARAPKLTQSAEREHAFDR
jgi:hypothetical protein